MSEFGPMPDFSHLGVEGKADLLLSRIPAPRLSYLPQEQLIEEVIRNYSEIYKTIDIKLDVAQTQPVELGVKGGVFQLTGMTNDDLSKYIDVRFNSPQASAIRFKKGDRLVIPFNRVWISYPAQIGYTATIAIAMEFDNIFRFDPAGNSNIGTISQLNTVLTLNNIEGLTKVPTGATEINVRTYVATGGANPTAFYTVTALKTLYVSTISLWCYYASSISFVSLRHTTSGGTLIKELAVIATGPQSYGSTFVFLPQYKIQAGEKLEIQGRDTGDASATGGGRGCSMWGWEI